MPDYPTSHYLSAVASRGVRAISAELLGDRLSYCIIMEHSLMTARTLLERNLNA